MNVRTYDVHVPIRGEERRGLVTTPTTSPVGLVVFVHGSGPGGADGFADYAVRFAELGVACLVVDKVMEGYTAMRRRYGLLADDCCDILRWARAQRDVDGLPTALLGYSEGSWVATIAAAHNPAPVDLLVLCSAPLTPPRTQTAYHRAHADRRRPRLLRAARYASAWATMAALTDYGNVDITADLAGVPSPVLLVLGADDPTIDVSRATTIFTRLRPGDVAPIVVAGADHLLPPDGDWIRQVAGALVAQAGTGLPE